jgi:hypothetical protein
MIEGADVTVCAWERTLLSTVHVRYRSALSPVLDKRHEPNCVLDSINALGQNPQQKAVREIQRCCYRFGSCVFYLRS